MKYEMYCNLINLIKIFLSNSIATVMRDSGCPVPDYMLGMKRLHKNTRRKLEKQSIARDEIRAKPHRYNK